MSGGSGGVGGEGRDIGHELVQTRVSLRIWSLYVKLDELEVGFSIKGDVGRGSHFKRDCRSGNEKNANASGSGKGSKDDSQDQDSVYMSSSTVVNSSLWHARLGHAHYKRMLEMYKVDFFPAIDCKFGSNVLSTLAMVEEDAFPVDDVEGGLCVRNTDAGIVGRCNSGSNKDKGKLRSYGIHLNPSTWQMILIDFKHTLKHGKDDLSLVQLGSHLRIEESLRAQESDKGKGKEVDGPSVNITEEVPTRNQSWNVGGMARLVTSKGIAVVVKRTTQMLVVRERGLRTNPNTKVDAIAWWIDSGATTHVCKDRCWFKTYEPVEDGFVLYMGDEHFTPVHGKGSVALEFSSGKTITLFNVLYVPKLCKNLVSGPVLNKYGYKQVYESDKYILSKSGVFVGFGYYNNGHVHYKRMLEMSKDDLIPAIDENPEKCTT
ncbi:zinc finger, CCHC-type containing protein, partial [Tanacetum coccineum]